MDADLAFTSALDQAEMIRHGEVSPSELVDGYLERIERLDPATRLVPHRRRRPRACRRAATPRSASRDGDVDDAPFLGVPISIKDLADTAGIRTHARHRDVRRPRSRRRRRGGRAHPARRLRHPRQDQHARVRLALHDREPRVPDRAQPVGHRLARPGGSSGGAGPRAWPPGSARSRTAPTAADRSASRPRGAGSSG